MAIPNSRICVQSRATDFAKTLYSVHPRAPGCDVMSEPTPFEISLVHELGQDVIRMANDWFFKWHSINIEGQHVDVEDFYGGRITVGGFVFQGQIQDIYWSSVGKHLVDRVHKGFRQWETECATY